MAYGTAAPGRQKLVVFTQHTTSCRCCLASRRSLVLRMASCHADPDFVLFVG